MTRRLGVIAAGLVAAAAASGHLLHATPATPLSGPGQQKAGSAPAVDSRATLDQYCVTCHNQRLKTAGLTLDTLDVTHVAQNAAVWEKVVHQLRAGAMPPAGRPRPDQATYDGLAARLETELDRAAAATPNPGKLPAFQRLTRTEYQNAIRDLLALDDLPKELDIATLLPADNSTSGFDNLRDLLFVSSTQMEQYLSAARKISRLAVGDPASPAMLDTYRISGEFPQGEHLAGTPFGARGGTVIRTNLPLDGDYRIEVELAGAVPGYEFEVSVDGERVQLFAVREPPPAVEAPLPPEARATTAFSKSIGSRKIDFEREQAALRRAAMNKGFEVLVPLKAGPREIIATFLEQTSARGEQVVRPAMRGMGGQPGVASVTIRGPYTATGPGDTASRRRLFACRPAGGADEARCARQILSTLARRAYRGPVTDADIQDLLPFYEAGRADGGFDTGIQWALERVLVSPQFLFRIESGPAAASASSTSGAYRISDLELASRLSFFLWSSIPDDELLDVAIKGRLKNPQVLEQQVRRMVADPRSRSLVNNFAAQWLFLRDLPAKNPNERFFRDFDEGLQQAFARETELFVDSILREDRSVFDLLDADYTFVNERLAKHYGIPNVYGSEFRRVALSGDSPRRGLLGKGSVLTLTAYATRTSPVLRGKYVLDNLLSSPPPPPPPNVPTLAEKSSDGKALSMREAMARHRANPVCASCHARMDPIGFALENFDAVGRWRDHSESGAPIDASAVLADGTKFDGVTGLRRQLLQRPEMFASSVTEKLLTYALGRKVAYYDAPVVRRIARDAARSDYHFSSLVLGIVNSVPFQMRSAASGETATAQQ